MHDDRAALTRLHALVEEEADSMTPFDRQHVQSTLELITEGLRRWADNLNPQLLVSTVCLLAKMKYFDGQLLSHLTRGLGSGGRLEAFTPRQASGLLWALGRYVMAWPLGCCLNATLGPWLERDGYKRLHLRMLKESSLSSGMP